MPCVVAVMVSAHREEQKYDRHINRPRFRLENVNELLKKKSGSDRSDTETTKEREGVPNKGND
jgi:hypothetical protein